MPDIFNFNYDDKRRKKEKRIVEWQSSENSFFHDHWILVVFAH
jgi:hypothetical protein